MFQPMLATIAVDACAGLNSTSPEVFIIIIIISIMSIIRTIEIIGINFSQVDLAGAVLANSTVGAKEMISWACDQYLGKSSSSTSS